MYNLNVISAVVGLLKKEINHTIMIFIEISPNISFMKLHKVTCVWSLHCTQFLSFQDLCLVNC